MFTLISLSLSFSLSLPLSLTLPSLHPFPSSLPHTPYSQNLLNEKGATYVFNHVHLILAYHKGSAQNKFTDGRIVRAQIQLASCKDFPCTPSSKPLKLRKQKDSDDFKITYSYTVEFVVSKCVCVCVCMSLCVQYRARKL